MRTNELLNRIRREGAGIVERSLPREARAELERIIRDGRQEVDTDAYLMFMSIRALLREDGMASFESDREAGRVMALLDA